MQNNLLPLGYKENTKKILVTGPLAEETNYAISRYGPSHNPVTSVLDGIKNYVGNNAYGNYMQKAVIL